MAVGAGFLAKVFSFLRGRLTVGVMLWASIAAGAAIGARWWCHLNAGSGACAFAESNGWLIGFGVVMFCMLMATVTDAVLVPPLKERRLKRRMGKRLHDLPGDEREVLRRYIDANARTIEFPFDNGTVHALMKARILFRSGKMWRGPDRLLDFSIQPWAMEYLRKHPELLA